MARVTDAGGFGGENCIEHRVAQDHFFRRILQDVQAARSGGHGFALRAVRELPIFSGRSYEFA
jgi:hypothetical protein